MAHLTLIDQAARFGRGSFVILLLGVVNPHLIAPLLTRKTETAMKMRIMLTVVSLAVTTSIVRAQDAREIYDKQCLKCHGAEGKGDTKAGRLIKAADFTDPTVQEKFSDEQMFTVIKEGVKDDKGKFKMKPAEGVTDDDIKALVKLVRSFKK